MSPSILAARSQLECSTADVSPMLAKRAGKDALLATLSLAAYLDWPPTVKRSDRTYRPLKQFPSSNERNYGLAYVVYGRFDAATPEVRSKRVFAYRGTEFTEPSDWFLGNAPLIRMQYRLAEKRLREELRERHPNEEIIFTGHSLGGGLAVTMWRYHADSKSRAVSFNGSPLLGCIFAHRSDRPCRRERRGDIAGWHNAFESGEPTRIIGNLLPWRWNWLLKHWQYDRDAYYHRYHFADHAFVSDHSMAMLANNLACRSDESNADLVPAIEAIQCLRDHNEDHEACRESIRNAARVLHFDEQFRIRRGAP
ncbi:MAG: hypothetical protein HYV17_14945 [Xanthomonadales bacterium]|nr:hypothetical protein [Xanthomonadales bacterium]